MKITTKQMHNQQKYSDDEDDDYGSEIYVKSGQGVKIQLELKKSDLFSPNFFVSVSPTDGGNCAHETFNIFFKHEDVFNVTHVNLKMSQYVRKGVFLKLAHDGEFSIYSDLKNWIQNNGLILQFWKSGSVEEEQKCLEFTDCVIRVEDAQKNTIVTYPANINELAVSSKVIYNMIQDLQESFSHEKPLDLTELFHGFDESEIHAYLCCVYNPYCVPTELTQILSLLKISIKLDNQGMIKRILGMKNMVRIVRQQIVSDDDDDLENPCHVQNVFNFAKQHDFHELMLLCNLEIVKKKGNGMATILHAYKMI
eukprot:TRINITY_DN8426_c0_g1_i5.p1 TRINITY_DN8426_c0_g1~~TRINITY_DN8426_c0_g1_i5.p1  ORF type:complete len:322 (+),score=43.10 TRINITY_DN8426_c0_g1_i5:38-967(+)